MGPVSWKNASTLIVLARNRLSQAVINNKNNDVQKLLPDYSCMLLKRSSQSKFFANAFVFPGGATEVADFSPSWLEHFDEHGFNREKLASQFVVSQQDKVPLYADIPNSDCIPEVGYRISAIRETFEETGVLFCKPAQIHGQSNSILKADDLIEWQKRIHHNPEEFLILCKKYFLLPDLWSLYEWSNWLTPTNMGPKRYDTMFYVCVIDNIPDVRIDGKEITQVLWTDPYNAILKHVQGHIWLAPPQLYELCRFAQIDTVEDLKIFCKSRQQKGIERWLPIRSQSEEGYTTILPGDSLYPVPKDTNTPNIEDRQLSTKHTEILKNRICFTSPNLFRIVCNVIDPHGHKQPRNLVDEMTENIHQSKM
ncbi:nucleoside diphosphate-linked moiety X motif 19 [Daphnia magna]|uniref:nucleoside diphosphate-linked moiety X motif 19 n=1 Tax=Daphnia magna TaxID=35525 RepID=UPI00140356FE|nr:nucleoside diphosphate-linked moiety X motif 19 [Daphnia magna]